MNNAPIFFNATRSLSSWQLVLLTVLPVMFILSVLGWVILDFISGLGIATGFAVQYLSFLKGLITIMDSIIIFTGAMLVGAIFLRSFQLNMHPVFGVLGLVVLPLVVTVGATAGNMVGVFTSMDLISNAANHFALSFTLFNNIGKISAGIGVLILLVMVGGGVLARR